MDEPDAKQENELPMEDVRQRIVAAAAELIAAGGRDAATTRAVATAAGVQAPTIYRLFGDKSGLLDAVAEHGLAAYVAAKVVREPHPDPVEELRKSWDLHVAFGLAHPGLFSIMSGDPRPRPPTPAVAAGLRFLRQRMRSIALAGRLRVSEDRAISMLRAFNNGTVLTLLEMPEAKRDPELSQAAREAFLSAITGEPMADGSSHASGAAAALRACLDETAALTGGERHLLEELLDRIANEVRQPVGPTNDVDPNDGSR